MTADNNNGKKIYIFIDTNIFLGFYETKPDRLSELEKLVDLANSGAVSILLPEQTIREFWRNRERTIKISINEFEQRKSLGSSPVIVREHEKFSELESLCNEADKLKREISLSIKKEIDLQELYADNIIRKIFSISKKIDTDDEEIFAGARKRALCHIPPGKNDDIGDRLCWVSLLKKTPTDSALYVVSNDEDYKSEGFSDNIRPYLEYEWKTKNGGTVKLFNRISQLISEIIDSAKKAIEDEKYALANKLKESGSFAETHSVIERISKYKDFDAEQLRIICDTVLENDQVRWIIGDEDVRQFYQKILVEYKDVIGSDFFEELSDMLKRNVVITIDGVGCMKDKINVDEYIEYLKTHLSDHYDVVVKNEKANFGASYHNNSYIIRISVDAPESESKEIEKDVLATAKAYLNDKLG